VENTGPLRRLAPYQTGKFPQISLMVEGDGEGKEVRLNMEIEL
jgi:hypothetical protein